MEANDQGHAQPQPQPQPQGATVEQVHLQHPHTKDLRSGPATPDFMIPLMGQGYVQVHPQEGE